MLMVVNRLARYSASSASRQQNRLSLAIKSISGPPVTSLRAQITAAKLRVNVDAQDNIVRGDWDGNNGGCAVFTSRLQ
jgi:hypothetical protein